MSGYEALSKEAIQARIARTIAAAFVKQVVYYPQIASTNDACRELADSGALEGALVVADEQVAGRGRLGRRWLAPPGRALLLSLLFRPALDPIHASQVTMLCGLAAAEAVEAETGLQAGLKWPNDLVLGNDKFGGLLAELGLASETLDYLVVGLGLNVNFDPRPMDGTGRQPTSLQVVLGHPVDRLALLAALLGRVAVHYAAFRDGVVPLDEWRARLVTLGRRVTVSEADRQYTGLAETTDEDGALWIRLDDGTHVTVHAGDITLRPEGLP